MTRSFVALCLLLSSPVFAKKEAPVDAKIYSFSMDSIDGKAKKLADYKGKVLLVMNVASFCGNTPQYTNMEKMYQKYKDKGFTVLAFPANNFGKQEPGTNAEIKEFCSAKYKTSFDLFSKISVKGDDIHPLYKYLTTETDFKGDVEWNFGKFVVGKDGKVAARFKAGTDPMTAEVVSKVEELLAVK